MCALVLMFQVVPDFPVVLGANRDERFDRPASGVTRWDARIPWIGPRDEEQGGSWIGASAAGVVAAVTNRGRGHHDPGRRTRGELVPEALSCGSAAAARPHLLRWLADRAYNGFHLLVADAMDAFVIRGGDSIESFRLSPGAHLITNDHELGRPRVPQVDRIRERARERPLLETVSDLADLLRAREPIGPDGFVPLKDLGDRGTRSSTLVACGDPGRPAMFLHADGPPDRTVFEDRIGLLKS